MKITGYLVQKWVFPRWRTVVSYGPHQLKDALYVGRWFKEQRPERKWRVKPTWEGTWRAWVHWSVLLPLRLLTLSFLLLTMLVAYPSDWLGAAEKALDRLLNRWSSKDE